LEDLFVFDFLEKAKRGLDFGLLDYTGFADEAVSDIRSFAEECLINVGFLVGAELDFVVAMGADIQHFGHVGYPEVGDQGNEMGFDLFSED
jgi:hypothetical protein